MPPATLNKGLRARGKSIQFDFRYEGIRNKETLKLDPTVQKNITFANNKLGAIKHEIAIGTFNYAKHFPNSKRLHIFGHSMATNMTVGETVDWYFELKKKDWRKANIKTSSNYISNPTKTGISHTHLRKIKISQIKQGLSQSNPKQKILNKCLGRGTGPL